MKFGKIGKGTLTQVTSKDNTYFKCTYTLNNKSYTVHIIETDFTYTGVIPAVSDHIQPMADLYPPTSVMAKSKIIGKITGNFQDRDEPSPIFNKKVPFYGVFHQFGILNKDGFTQIGLDHYVNDYFLGEGKDGWFRYSPALCITSSGSAKIHWFSSKDTSPRMTIKKAIGQYQVIISGQHCMVYQGKSVFDTTCVSAESNGDITIANWGTNGSGLTSEWNHHNERVGGFNSTTPRARAFLGHASNGHCFMVVVEGDMDWDDPNNPNLSPKGINLKEGAQLMVDLGCDYALNMDGGGPTRMEYMGKEVFSCQSNYKLGSAVCAFDIRK